MYNGPMFFKGSMEVMLFIVLVSFLFVWLFNAYRLRELVFLFIIGIVLAAAALEPFL